MKSVPFKRLRKSEFGCIVVTEFYVCRFKVVIWVELEDPSGLYTHFGILPLS